MREYSASICRAFLDAYPKSAAFSGGRRLRIGSWERRYPEITKDFAAKDAFIESVEYLQQEGLLEIRWVRFRAHEQVEALYLLDSYRLYEHEGLLHPKLVDTQVSLAIEKIQVTSPLAIQVYEALVSNSMTLRTIFSIETPEELIRALSMTQDIITLCELTREHRTSHTIRELSIRLFNDSKRIEALVPYVGRLSTKVALGDLVGELGLERSYPEVTFYLEGTLCFSDKSRLSSQKKIMTLPYVTIIELEKYEPTPQEQRILLLENKESFFTAVKNHTEESLFQGYLYLGGFPDSATSHLIEKLAGTSLELYCFCDLDPSGLLIAEQVQKIAKREVLWYQMDSATYLRYKEYGYPLIPSELKKLTSSIDHRFTELKELINASSIGLEQEIIPIG